MPQPRQTMFNEQTQNFLFDLILDNYPEDKKTWHLLYSSYNKFAGNFKDIAFTCNEAYAMFNLLQLEIINGNKKDFVKQLQASFKAQIK